VSEQNRRFRDGSSSLEDVRARHVGTSIRVCEAGAGSGYVETIAELRSLTLVHGYTNCANV
jgi:hypothetical protein